MQESQEGLPQMVDAIVVAKQTERKIDHNILSDCYSNKEPRRTGIYIFSLVYDESS